MALAAVAPLALGIGKALFNKGKKASSNYMERPSMQSYGSFKSKYDDPSSKQVYDFYKGKSDGSTAGLAADDLNMLNAEAIDQSHRQTQEYKRVVGNQARPSTGVMTRGRADRNEREAIGQYIGARSKAMRDVAIQNAVLKHDDQFKGTSGLQTFLNSERTQQGNLFEGERKKTLYEASLIDKQEAEANRVDALNRQRKSNFYNDMFGAANLATTMDWKSILNRQ